MKVFGSVIVTAIVLTFLLGAPLPAAFFVFVEPSRLGAPGWPLLIVSCAGLTVAVAILIRRRGATGASVASLALAMFSVLSFAFVGTYAELLRRDAIRRFEPDLVFQNSFLMSLQNAPREYQFFLHAGAMKDCIPYAWSYRDMGMYEMPQGVMFNVLPSEWLKSCGLKPPR